MQHLWFSCHSQVRYLSRGRFKTYKECQRAIKWGRSISCYVQMEKLATYCKTHSKHGQSNVRVWKHKEFYCTYKQLHRLSYCRNASWVSCLPDVYNEYTVHADKRREPALKMAASGIQQDENKGKSMNTFPFFPRYIYIFIYFLYCFNDKLT